MPPVAPRRTECLLAILVCALLWLAAPARTQSLGSAMPDGGLMPVNPAQGSLLVPPPAASEGWTRAAMPLDTGGGAVLFGGPVLPLGSPTPPREGRSTGGARFHGQPTGRRDTPTRRCTDDGVHCISLETYIPDVCHTIEATAQEAGLDPHFFARLLWQESGFNANAVSHAGAQGIAQFMPGTARLRGLDDAFNPAKALRASAQYLAEMTAGYGNVGLAAAAYNSGEGRVNRFVAGSNWLPEETRTYVPAITGVRADKWRDGKPRPDLRLDGATPFVHACMAKAKGRGISGFRGTEPEPPSAPWAVVVAAHRSAGIARHRYDRIARRNPVLKDLTPDYVERQLPDMPGKVVAAQFATSNQSMAEGLCRKLSEAGVPCRAVSN